MVTKSYYNPIRKIFLFLVAGIFLSNMEINSAECVNAIVLPENSTFFSNNFNHDVFCKIQNYPSVNQLSSDVRNLVYPENITRSTDKNSCSCFITSGLNIIDRNNSLKLLTWQLTGATVAESAKSGVNQMNTFSFYKGITTVNYSGKDKDDNSFTHSFTVRVIDNQPPKAIYFPGNITLFNIKGTCHARVNWNKPQFTDNCVAAGDIRISSNYKSGDNFEVGTTVVRYIVSDGANEFTQSFEVTVIDNEAPELVAPERIVAECGDPIPDAYTSWEQFENAGGRVSDNCEVDYSSFRYIRQASSGVHCPYTVVRTYKISDVNGNESQTQQFIDVTGEEKVKDQPTVKETEAKEVLKSGTGNQSVSISLVQLVDVSCYGGNDGSIDLDTSSTNGPITSIVWDHGPTSLDLTGLSEGTYRISVTDGDGTFSQNFTVNQPNELNASVSSTNITCNGANDGTITVSSPAGGYGTYEYRVNSGTWQSSGNFSSLSPDTYAVEIRDAANPLCAVFLGGVNLTEPPVPTVNPVSNQDLCNGENTTTVNFSGTANSFSWTNNNTSIGLAASGNGNIIPFAATNGGSAPVTATITVTPIYTNLGVDCSGSPQTFTITVNPDHTISLSSTTGTDNQIICDSEAISAITYTVGGGGTGATVGGLPNGVSGTYSGGTFTISGTPGESGTFNYTVTTTGNSCNTASAGGTITIRDLLTAPVISSSQDICYNTVPQTLASTAATGGSAPYNHQWQQSSNGTSGWSNVSSATNAVYSPPALTSTTFYRLEVTDAGTPSCGTEYSNVIEINVATELTVVATETPIVCKGGSSTVTLAANGGTPPYSYIFNGISDSDGIIQNVTEGTYTWSVTDALSCEPVTGTINITAPPMVTATIAITDEIDCSGETGEVTISASGGTPPYEYTFNGVAQSSNVFTGIMAGVNLTWSVRDANGCEYFSGSPVDMISPDVLTASVVATDVLCNGGNNGSIDLTVAGGTLPYTFSWDNGAGTSEDPTGLTADTYTVNIVDGNGCSTTASAIVNEPPTLSASVDATNILCFGQTSDIQINAGGGTSPYTYTFDGNSNATGSFPAMAAANGISWQVVDANACIYSGTYDLTQPAELQLSSISATDTEICEGENIVLSSLATGGSGTLTYNWQYPDGSVVNNAQNPTVINADVSFDGTFILTVSDMNACSVSGSIDITVHPTPSVNPISDIVECHDVSVGSIVISGSNADSYDWAIDIDSIWDAGSSGTGNIPAFTTNNGGDAPVTATVTITPRYTGQGCSGVPETFTITVNPKPVLNITNNTPILCDNGVTSIVLSSNVAGTIFDWTGSDGSFGTGNIIEETISADVTYTITPRTTDGCIGDLLTTDVDIISSEYDLEVNPQSTPPANYCQGEDFSLNFRASNQGAGSIINYTFQQWWGSNWDELEWVTRFLWNVDNPNVAVTTSGGPIGNGSVADPDALTNLTISLINYTDVEQTATISITPWSYSRERSCQWRFWGGTSCSSWTSWSSQCAGDAYEITITVQPFAISCPENIIINTDHGDCDATLSPGTPAVSCDPGSNLSWSMSGSSNDSGSGIISAYDFLTGTTIVTYRATETGSPSNYRECSFNVTVNDNEAPDVTSCPSDVTQNMSALVCGDTVTFVDPVFTDNCDGILSATRTDGTGFNSGDVFPVGATTITYYAVDAAGNDTTCSFDVTILPDSNGPDMTCVGNQSGCAPYGGTYLKTGIDWDAVAIDNCPGVINLSYTLSGASSGTGSSLNNVQFNVGTTTVTWSATDINANNSTCSFDVVITEAPGFVLNPVDVSTCLNGSATFTASAAGIPSPGYQWRFEGTDIPGATDTFFTITNVQPSDAGNYDVIVSNSCGTATSSKAVLTVSSAPVIAVNPASQTDCFGESVEFSLVASGGETPYSYTWEMRPSLTDAWGPASTVSNIAVSDDRIIVSDIGDSNNPDQAQYRVIVTDFCGNADTSSVATLTVNQIIFPTDVDSVTVCQDEGTTFSVNTSGSVPVSYEWQLEGVTITDNAVYSGTTTQTLTITNAQVSEGGTYSARVTFNITQPNNNGAGITTCLSSFVDIGELIVDEGPDIVASIPFQTICPGSSITQIDLSNANGTPGTTYSWTRDNPGVLTGIPASGTGNTITGVLNSLTPGTMVTTTFNITALANGCPSTTTVAVTVGDTTMPTQATCPADIVVNTDAGLCNATVSYTVPTFDDDCDGTGISGNLVEGLASGVQFPIGVTTVKYIYTDATGNVSDTCSFDVTVADNEQPSAICQNITVQLDDAGVVSITPAAIDNGSSDGCGLDSLRLDMYDFDCTDVGSNTVTLTAVDLYGNEASCSATVTVQDTVKPVVSCQDIDVYLDINGQASITASDIDNGSSDNCGIASLGLSETDFTCNDVGANSVTLTVTDDNGNSNTCNAFVNILDTISPNAVCKDISVQLNGTGSASVSANDLNNGSTDNCGIDTIFISKYNFDCSEVGSNSVTFTVVDDNGNSSTCTAAVTVEDAENPIARCKDVTIQLDANGVASLVAADIDNGSSDNCGAPTLNVSPNSFDCTNLGSNTVTLTATDAYGNDSTCQATVTLADDNFPVDISAGVTQTEIFCNGDVADISIAVSGGVGSLTYTFNGVSQPGNTFSGIGAGTYTWSVIDPFGCGDTTGTFEVVEPEPLQALLASLDASCSSGNDGEIRISASGGSNAFEFSIDGGSTWDSDTIFTGLSPGFYNVQMRDANVPTCFVVLDPALEIIILDADITVTNVDCYGGNNGAISISNPDGGSGSYQFTINGGLTWNDYISGTYTYSGLVADTFDVWIRDANDLSCVIPLDTMLVIPEPDSLFATIDSTNITCFGADNGTITLHSSTGGTGVYEYSIDGGTSWTSDPNLTGLTPGNYDVRMRDTNGCEKILNTSLTLTEPEILSADIDSANITCSGNNDGEIILSNLYGGYGSYEFSIDGGANWQTDTAFNGLYAGTYDVRIRDITDPSCYIVLDPALVLSEPPALNIVSEPGDITDCLGAGVVIGVGITGGAGTVSYEWQRMKPSEGAFTTIPGDPNVLNQDTDSLQLLNIGNADAPDGTRYRVIISDNCAVLISDTVTLTVNEIIAVTPDAENKEICEGRNYSLQVSTSGGTPVSYQWQIDSAGIWDDLSNSTVISGVDTDQLALTGATTAESGQYRVIVTFPSSGSDCDLSSETFVRNLTVHPLPVVDSTSNIIVCHGETISEINFSGTGTSYDWMNNETSIGLAASGNGNITSFTAINTDTVPVTSEIVVTPVGLYCNGLTDTFTIIVNPLPEAVAPTGVIFCDAELTNPYPLSGIPSNVVFDILGGTTIGLSDATDVNAIPSFNPVAGTATITLTPKLNGCTGTPVTFDILVVESPDATISGGDTVCQGALATNLVFESTSSMIVEATYTVNGTDTNTVVIPLFTPVQIPVPTNNPGVFTYELIQVAYITEPYCFTTDVNDTAQIVVIEPPVPTISGPDEVCAATDGHVYTTEAGMTDYVWNVSSGGVITAGGDSLSNTVTITWNTPGSKNVSVRYTDGNSCSASMSTIYPVTVDATPVPTITGSGNVCEDETVTYTTQSGMADYLWVVSAGGTITTGGTLTDNFVTIDWSGAGNQTVSVNYTNGNGCTADSATLSITQHDVYVNPEPEPSLNGADTACTGTEHVYTTDAGMINYIWTVSAGGNILSGGTFNDNTATVRWNVAGAQSIGVNYIDTAGCSASSDSIFEVKVHQSPEPVINGPKLICAGSANATYRTEPGMTNYSWTVSAGGTITGGANDSIVYVTWNTIGNHTISVDYTNENNCNAVTPTTESVEAVNEVVPTITGVDTVCEGNTGNYTTQSGMSEYDWIITGGSIVSGGDSASSSVTVLWDSAGLQTVSVGYLSTNGCYSIVTDKDVQVDPMPNPTISGATSTCLDTITYTYTTEPGMTNYQWIYSSGAIVISGGGSNDDYIDIQWNILGPQTVSVNYSNSNGCRATSANIQNVIVNELTPVSCPDDTSFCVNAGIVNLVEGSPAGGVFSGAGVSGNTFDPLVADAGTHTITYSYTNDSSCISSCTFDIRVDPQPVVSDQYITVCSESALEIHLNDLVPDAAFIWTAYDNSGGGASVSGFTDCNSSCDTVITDILVNSSISEPVYSTGNPGTVVYEVTALHNGCSGTFNIIVTVEPSIIELEHSWNSNFIEDFIEVCAGAQALSSNDLEILHPTRTSGYFNSNGLLINGSYFNGGWNPRILYGQSEEGPWVQAPHGEGAGGDGWNDSEGPYQWIVDFAINDRLGYHYFIVELTDPNTGCIKYSHPAILNIVSSLKIEAGGPDFLCSSSSPTSYTLEGAYVGGLISSPPVRGTWSITSLNPANGSNGTLSSTGANTTPGSISYTPPADYVGDVTLTLTSSDPDGSGECVPLTDERIIHILPPGSFDDCLDPLTWNQTGSPGHNGYLDDNQASCAVTIVGSDNSSGSPGSFGIAHCAGAGTLSFDWYFTAPVNEIVWHQEDQQEGGNNGYSSRLYVAPPTNIEEGDLIIVTIHVNNSTGTISDNDGEFIEIRRDTYSGQVTLASFYKIATAADVGRTSDYRFNLSNVDGNDRIYSVRVTGADQNQATVIGNTSGIAQYLTYPTRDYMNATIPAVNVTNSNSMLVSALSINISGSSGDVEYINSPLGSTTMYYEDYETTARVAQQIITTTGSSGEQTFSWPSYNTRNRYNMYVAAHTFIINPATPDVDAAYYLTGSTPVLLSDTDGSSGSVSVPVSGGEDIAFAVSTNFNTGGPGELIICNLDIPNDPPVADGDTLIEFANCQVLGFDPDTAFVEPMVYDDCDTFRLQTGYPITSVVTTSDCENSQVRTWLYVDDCGGESNTFTQRITWSVIDSIQLNCPLNDTLPACSDVASIQTAYDAWKTGFSFMGGCETVVDNLNELPVLTDLTCGGQIEFTLIVSDACGQVDSCTSYFVVQAAEDLALSCPNDTVLPACTDTSDIKLAYETWRAQFDYTGGCTSVTSNIDSIPELSDLSCGGQIEFRYVVNLGSPSCPNSVDCYSTFTVESPSDLKVVVPPDASLPLCSDTASIRAAYNTWAAAFTTTGGCDVITNIDSIPELTDLTCGGSISFIFMAHNGSGKCADAATDSSSFSVIAPPPLTLTCPADPNLPGCAGIIAITNAYNNWVDGFTALGGCDISTNINEVPPLGDLLCDGQLSFTFVAQNSGDVCTASDSCTSTFSIGTADSLVVSCPGDTIVEGCTAIEVQTIFNNWIAQFSYTGGCNANESDLSIYTPPVTCGGVVIVNYIVSDECGQADSCSAFFQVEAPDLVITLPEDTLLDACQSQLDIDVAFADWISRFGYSGGCNVLATDVSLFTAPDICGGEIIVNYSATDACGQAETRAAFFAIDIPLNVDLIPSFTVPGSASLYSDADCSYDADPLITGYPANLKDNCTQDSLLVSYVDSIADGSCLGEYIIYRSWTVTDNCGNDTTQLQIINVLDTLPPEIVCPANASEYADPNQCHKTGMDMGLATATDNCTPDDSIVISNDAPAQLPVGTTVVTWTATDDCGNTSTCMQLVTIVDTIPPNIDINGCQDVTEAAALNNCSKVPDTMLDPVYSDDCWPTDSLVLTYSVTGATTVSGTGSAAVVNYNVGVSFVTYTITDPDGLQDSCSFTVTIVDVTPPGIEIGGCVDVSDTAAANNCSKIPATIVDPTYSDNCWPVDSLSLTWTMTGATNGSGSGSVVGETFHVGTTTVQYIVSDPDGNADSCEFDVSVIHLDIPTANYTCPQDSVFATAGIGSCEAYVTLDPLTYVDPCNEIDSVWNESPYRANPMDASGNYPVGTTTFQWYITDISGNIDSCEVTVIVKDLPPNLVCPPDVDTTADYNEMFNSSVFLQNPTYSDNCPDPALTWRLVPPPGYETEYSNSELSGNGIYVSPDTFWVGVTTIWYKVTDSGGNQDSCFFTVTVHAAPEIDCPPDTTIYLEASDNDCQATFDPGVADLIEGVPPITWTYTLTNPDGSTVTDTYVKNAPDPEPDPFGDYNFKVGTTTIEWRAENVSGFDTCSHWVEVIDTIPPAFTTPDFKDCVDPIHWALYNPTNPNPVYGVGKNLEITPSPDYRTFEAGDTSLDLLSLEDNCCDSTDMTIYWEIIFSDTPDPLDPTGLAMMSHDTISGTGQPSTYSADIKLWGDGVHFTEVTHSIRYWIEDCNGSVSDPITKLIVVTPRPQIIKLN